MKKLSDYKTLKTFKPLMRSSLAKDVEKFMRARGINLEDLIDDLKKQRRQYNERDVKVFRHSERSEAE